MPKKIISLQLLNRTIEVLQDVFDEIDIGDPDYDEGLLKTAITTLINEDLIEDVDATDATLSDLLQKVLGDQSSEELLDRAQTFDNLIDTYTGEPSEEDVKEAREHLDEILKGMRKKAQALAKRKLKEEGLWRDS